MAKGGENKFWDKVLEFLLKLNFKFTKQGKHVSFFI